MSLQINYTSLGKAVNILRPDIVREIEPRLFKPQPALIHIIKLPALFSRFCELKQLNENYISNASFNRDVNEIKILFTAVAIILYNPDFLTGFHSNVLKSTLACELSGLLNTNRTWLSQQTQDIKRKLNQDKTKPAHEAFKNEAYKIAKVLEIEFGK